ncbi:MAG: bifunctional enoyl-CoA hydratase/phosphate acetyltransferase [Burkholderiales bacterium]|nr:bifunctional enoyl-CoA hydratase/phosphate acetyltransferase [Burkholderiales bacterium]
MPTFANKTFDEIDVGASITVTRPLSLNEVEALALVSGDMDAFHLADEAPNPPDGVVAKAVGAEALISTLIARQLPGPGSTIVAQDLRFAGQVGVGEPLDVTVTAREKRPDGGLILFDCRVRSGDQDLVSGTALVRAPTQRLTYTDIATPQLLLRRNDAFAKLLRAVEGLSPAVTAVVHPCDRDSLLGPIEAAKRGLIVPLLVGPEAKIRAVAQAEGVDLSPYRIVPTEHSHAAAQQAVAMARAGEVEALMKGSLHTDELMAAVVPSATGIRTARRVSHVFVLDVPAYPRPLLVTDAAINIYPTLEDKVDIVQNAIELAHVLGLEMPRVALLSAMETVNPKVQSTLDAAALCKMADRGQITGGVLDGPLAFDNAISEEAARTKKIVSPVAGRADILVVPDLEAGNMLAKQLQYFAGADSAGIVLGTRVPIVLTSRADSVRTRLASTAVMLCVADAKRRTGKAPAL